MSTEMARRWFQESLSTSMDEDARFRKIADYLKSGPKRIHAIAAHLGVTVDTAMNLMDAMLAHRFAREAGEGLYAAAQGSAPPTA
jgi:hypothetical protein